MSPVRETPFADRLAVRVLERETRLVVGIDPIPARFPAALKDLEVEEALVRFSQGVIDAVASTAAAVKPQIGFFEAYGWRGFRAFQRTVELSQEAGIPVIADIKRGDIGSTAEGYAAGFLGEEPDTPGPFVDAVTLSPYLGRDSLEPFLERAVEGHRGLFVLTRTSNPGGADVQLARVDGEPLYRCVARLAEAWSAPRLGEHGYGPVGLVAGATFPEEMAQIRADAPHGWLLLPGLGAQGASAAEVSAAFDARGLGAVASSSRQIIYAYENAPPERDWTEAVAAAAESTRTDLNAAVTGTP